MEFTTRQLLMAIKEKGIRRDNFFLRMFFPEIYTFSTEKVDLDMVPNRPKIAPFCSPMIGGQVDRNQGYETTSFKPAYVKSKHVVNGNMTLKRMPGEAPTALKTPEERQALHVMQNLDLEEEAVSMREELMAAQMIIHGEYLVDGPNIEEPYVISSPRKAENNITLIGDARWTQKDRATFDPLAEITKESNKADGQINIIALDKKAWALINEFKKFTDKLETRRGSKSELETALKDLGKAVSYKGYVGDVEFVVVDEEYTARDGSTQKVVPAYTIILGHTSARGLRLYGAIQDLKAQQEGYTESERYVRDWTEGNDPVVRYTKTECAPAPYMSDANSFVVLTVASDS